MSVTPDDMRAELAARFAARTNNAALWLPPEVLLAHYTTRMPAERLEQLEPPASNACIALLRRRLDLAHLPRLRAALSGVHAELAEVDLAEGLLLGAETPTPERLVASQPTLEALDAPTLFGSGVPMLEACTLVPPPLAQRRGARRIIADGVTSTVASALCALSAGAHTLDAETRLRFA